QDGDNSNSGLPSEIPILVLTPQKTVELDAVALEPVAGVGIDVPQLEIGPGGADPDFAACFAQRHGEFSGMRVDRHGALESALSVGELALSVGSLSQSQEPSERHGRVDVSGIG